MTDPIYTPPRLRIISTWPVADGGTPQTVEIEVNDGRVTAEFVAEVLAALDRKAATTHIHVDGQQTRQISAPSWGPATSDLTDIVRRDGRLP